MATLKTAASSIFGTIGQSAEAVGSLVNTTASGIHMVNDYVVAQRLKQQDSIKVSLADHRVNLIEDAALLNAERAKKTKKFLSENPDMAETYLNNRTRLEALFENPSD